MNEPDDDPIEDIKRWFHSKTIWTNLVALVIELLGMAEPLVPHLEAFVPGWLFHVVAFALPLINCALRFITHKAIR
jgi:hypothetical protein